MLTLNTDVKQDKPPVSRKGKEKQQVGAVSAAERLTRERAGSLFSESEASSQDMALSEQVSAMRIQPEKDKTGSKESSTKPPPAPEKDKASAKPGPTKLTERRGIKPMPMPLTGGSGGISTKARVAQGLHTPTTPSVASPAVPPTAPKDPLKGLSFKKKKPTEDIIARNASFAAPAAAPSPAAELGPSVSRREKATVSILEDAPFVQSPVSVQDAGHEFPFGPQSPAELPPDPRRRSGPPPLPRYVTRLYEEGLFIFACAYKVTACTTAPAAQCGLRTGASHACGQHDDGGG
ncbi:hypothetical protein OBBRIDRAFT_15482 [Obba rivulosa]|uniref:Uncharacterized protein n=1 Tax=Obba rivulosa TaxID=1052685 RepID=A0A8E2J8C8_9APHY|nr:hypothetical protein OBBRIDRAFT_15482 [Obba rivulosa]